MAAAAAALPIVGGFVGAAGAKESAQAQANAQNYNAAIANQNAAFTEQETTEEVRRQGVLATQTIGQERASYGASGVSSTTGSALDVLQQSAKNAALDALTIQHSGDMKAWAYRSGAQLDKMGADQSLIAGDYGAVSAGLGGASGAAKSIYGS
jgi:hypothetical protein